MRYPPAPPIKVPDEKHRVFLLSAIIVSEVIKTTACEERSFYVEFFVRIFVFVRFSLLYTFFAQKLPL